MNLFSPAEVAKNFIATGKAKANLSIGKMIVLGMLAGIFIGVGALGCTTIGVSVQQASLARFLGASVFPGGLTMCLVAGSELFTGNCLMPISVLEKEIKMTQMLKNWVVVYIANLAGAIILSALIVYSHQPSLFDNAEAVAMIKTGIGKCSLSFGDAFLKGIVCNFLVCIAVWMAFAAKDVAGKFIGLFFPIMLFVMCGFEHSIANMGFISCGLLCKTVPAYADAAVAAGLDMTNLTWANFFGANLLPVTLGNIVGGCAVAFGYWFVYLKKDKAN